MAETAAPAAAPAAEPVLPIPFVRLNASVRGLTPPARRAALRALVSDVLDLRRGGTCLR